MATLPRDTWDELLGRPLGSAAGLAGQLGGQAMMPRPPMIRGIELDRYEMRSPEHVRDRLISEGFRATYPIEQHHNYDRDTITFTQRVPFQDIYRSPEEQNNIENMRTASEIQQREMEYRNMQQYQYRSSQYRRQEHDDMAMSLDYMAKYLNMKPIEEPEYFSEEEFTID